jgi:hypothetical protein
VSVIAIYITIDIYIYIQVQIQFIINGNITYMIGVIRVDVHDITNTTQLWEWCLRTKCIIYDMVSFYKQQ